MPLEAGLELRLVAPQQRATAGLWYAAALLSLTAALVHLAVVPEHLGHWWAHGAFLWGLGLVQGAYGVALLGRAAPALLLLGIGGNLASVVLYLVTRAAGASLLGAAAGHGEAVGWTGLAAKAIELALVGMLWQLWRTAGETNAVPVEM